MVTLRICFAVLNQPERVMKLSRSPLLLSLLFCCSSYATPVEQSVNTDPAQLSSGLWQAFSHPAGQTADLPTLTTLFASSAVIYGSSGQLPDSKLSRTEVADFLKSLQAKNNKAFYECEIHREVQQFDRFAAVYSVVESRTDPTKTQADFTGLNSILLNQTAEGWKIVALYYHLPASVAELQLPLANTGRCLS
jgi:hypothetical protein